MVFILIGKHFDRKFRQKVSMRDIIAVIYTVLSQNGRLAVSVSFPAGRLQNVTRVRACVWHTRSAKNGIGQIAHIQ